ncbi:hypothetical protein [Streptomyces sp. SLBN-31]|uniref:hypothetical protein n=1 Tax=Streptomyces sp. SLBN-31 TaxID=2768444 RepID=UPI00116DBFD2|nr:hypothetical protein [Streptomyces sp. SLBN-31]TQJ92566.1 hypothetical protein FBY22_3444 [Streptomyces sp. SLBN-31]
MPVARAPARSQLPGSGLWRRVLGQVVCRRRRPTPVLLERPPQVGELLEVLSDAMEVQQRADGAVAACGEPGPVCAQAARDCGRVSSELHRLHVRLWQLRLTEADLAEIQARAGRLLAYDQWMVRQSLNLAFTAHPDARTEAARLQINGLGRPADDLRRLRDALRNQAAHEASADRRAREASRS